MKPKKMICKLLLGALLLTGCVEQSVYVTGWEDYESGRIPKLWKNGTTQRFTKGKNNDVVALSVYVSDNDVFIAGREQNEQKIDVAKLWKNGIASNLSGGKRDAMAFSVFVK